MTLHSLELPSVLPSPHLFRCSSHTDKGLLLHPQGLHYSPVQPRSGYNLLSYLHRMYSNPPDRQPKRRLVHVPALYMHFQLQNPDIRLRLCDEGTLMNTCCNLQRNTLNQHCCQVCTSSDHLPMMNNQSFHISCHT